MSDIQITLNASRSPVDQNLVKVKVPALPRIGDHVSHDKAGVSGTVTAVDFWWDEKGRLTIEARLR